MTKRTALTSLGIPQLDLSIVSRAQELGSIVAETDILDGLGVTHECPQDVPLVIDVPELPTDAARQ